MATRWAIRWCFTTLDWDGLRGITSNDVNMSKQTLVFESASALSIKNGLLSIVREGEEEVLRSLEDIQTI